MDTISQMALGAALGELVLGRAIGRRAAVLGAALGTLPDLDVLAPYADAADALPPLARLVWFADGFVRLRERDGTLVATDLRMGAESNYVFSFVVGERNEGGDWRPIVARERPPEVDFAALGRVLRRVVDERALQETR